jgi:hypothetical protein
MYPRTFAEFIEQHPKFVRQIILKQRWAEFDAFEDLEQEMLSELLRKRVVEKFDPALYDKALSLQIFMSYIKGCCERMFLTTLIQGRAQKRTLNNVAVSLSEPVTNKTGKSTAMIGDTIHDDNRSKRAMEAATEFDEFASYVIESDPRLETIINAMRALGSTNNKDITAYTGLPLGDIRSRMRKFTSLAKQWNTER